MKNKFLMWLSKPYLFWGCLAVSAFIISIVIFKNFWISFLNTVWIDPVMSKLYGHEWLVTIPSLFFLVIYYVREFLLSEKINVHRLYFWVIYTFLYLICIIWGPWDYSLMCYDSKVAAWTNLSLLPLVGEIAIALEISLKKRKDCEPSSLEVEKTENVEDTYGRMPICESSFDVLRTCFNNERSFSVAITGEWGSGKTTFMQELKAKYEKEEQVKSIVWFEPWKCDSPDLIIKSFFDLLRRELRVYIPSISSMIDEYVLTLLDNDAVKPLRLILAAFRVAITKEHESPYERIRKVLTKTQHNVVVFVDDIDRLDSEEIKEVLRLIRNTADFPYIQFIVAYDKEYVTQMLGTGGINDATKYLEKFFNIDIPLPKFEERRICEELYRRVSLFDEDVWLPKLDEAAVKDMVYRRNNKESDGKDSGYIVPNVLHTMRDVIRFSNALKLLCVTYKEQKIQEEIEFNDLFFLELLRYGFGEIYKVLRDMPLSVLDLKTGCNIYQPYEDSEGRKEIFSVLTGKYSAYNQSTADEILYQLFDGKRYPHSLRNLRDYAKYFMYRLDNKVLSDAEFISLSSIDDAQFAKQANELFENKGRFEFKNEAISLLSRTNAFDEEVNRKVRGLSYSLTSPILIRLCNLGNEGLKAEVSEAIGQYVITSSYRDKEQFQESLKLCDSAVWEHHGEVRFDIDKYLRTILIRDNLKSIVNDVDESYIDIIGSFLQNTNHPILMSAALCFLVSDLSRNNLSSKLLVEASDISDIQLSYLKEYPNKMSKEGVSLFLNCWDYSKIGQQSRPVLRNEALYVMKTAIVAESDKYFETFIHDGAGKWPDSVELFPAPYFDAIFGGYDEFEKFLNSAKQSPAQMRVKAFWTVYKSQGYRNIIVKNHAAAIDLMESDFAPEKLRSCVIS